MRVLLQQDSVLKRFATIVLTERDGSIVLTFPRTGTTVRSRWRVSPTTVVSEKVAEEEGAPKGIKITIHASGRINFDSGRAPIFVEPIWSLREVGSIVVHRLPDLEALDVFTDTPDPTDLIIDADPLRGPVAFEVLLVPAGAAVAGPGFSVSYLGSLSLVFKQVEVESIVPLGIADQLLTFYPSAGTRERQEIAEDVALIQFSKLFFEGDELMLDGPNPEGWYRLIFPVQMRVAPLPTVTPVDPSIEVEIKDQELDPRTNRVRIRFRFRDKGGVRKGPTAISSIEMDAELR